MRRGFGQGLGLSLESAIRILAAEPSRSWFGRAVVRSGALGLATLLLLNLLAFGGIFAATDDWRSWAAALLWLLASFFLSSRLAGLFMSLAAGLWVDEKGLFFAIKGEKVVRFERARIGDLGREWSASVVSGVISLAVAPLFFFPLLIPLALLPLAWAMGREATALGLRLSRQNLEGARDGLGARDGAFYAGLGLLPAVLALFPIIGWLGLPLLQYSGVRAVLGERPIPQNPVA